MINLFRTSFLKIIASTSIVILLQGCGGEERTTPYNPGTSSSSSSSLGASISAPILGSGTTLANTSYTRNEKQLVVIRELSEYNAILPDYLATIPTAPDFTQNQVVLIDLGDRLFCGDRMGLSSVAAHLEGNLRVKVTLNYADTSAQTLNCTQATLRNFYFYTVQSRKLVVFEENNSN